MLGVRREGRSSVPPSSASVPSSESSVIEALSGLVARDVSSGCAEIGILGSLGGAGK